jgi:uncharacterized coiled-coil DUF342 family protein
MKEEIENKLRRGENVTPSEILECFKNPITSLKERLDTLRDRKQKANPDNIDFAEYLALTEEIEDLEARISRARSASLFGELRQTSPN